MSNGVFTITAGGTGIPNTGSTDNFYFIHQGATDDVQITARVVSVGSVTGASPRCGVMIRETMSNTARHAFTALRSDSNGRFIYRTGTANNANSGSTTLTQPYWVRVTRAGNTFSAYAAPNVANAPGPWTQRGTSQTISMTNTVRVGLGAASGTASLNGTTVLDNVSITPPPSVNFGPQVSAGSDQTATNTSVPLDGTADDDGWLNPPGAFTTQWSQVSGPAAVSFAAPDTLHTSAILPVSGTYVLRLFAADGEVGTFDDVTVTVALALHQHTMTVYSEHGGEAPGTVTVDDGTALSLLVTNSPVAAGAGTQYVCVSGAVAGNDCTQVSPTQVTLGLTNDATLIWQWQTNHWLEVRSEENGSVMGTQGWYAGGTTAQLEAVPSNYYHFLVWTGTVTTATNPLSLWMEGPQAVVATFGENLASNETPVWWLAKNGLTNDTWDGQSLVDSDGDGMRNWQEWIAGTDPTNVRSLLHVVPVAFTASGRLPLTFASVTGRSYQVWQSSSLEETNWTFAPHAMTDVGPLTHAPLSGLGLSVTTFVQPDGAVRFYRIGVEKE